MALRQILCPIILFFLIYMLFYGLFQIIYYFTRFIIEIGHILRTNNLKPCFV